MARPKGMREAEESGPVSRDRVEESGPMPRAARTQEHMKYRVHTYRWTVNMRQKTEP